MERAMSVRKIVLAAVFAASGVAATAQEAPKPPASKVAANARPEARRALFGELHLHTTMSFDAWTFGTKVTPDTAYRFARGETVMVPAIQLEQEQGAAGKADVPAKRAWPLDFAAVTDHSEYLGAVAQLDIADSAFSKSPLGQQLRTGGRRAFNTAASAIIEGGAQNANTSDLKAAAVAADGWNVEMRAANAHYRPGVFTTFLGYEWTATPGRGVHMHRNVIFSGDKAPPPFTANDSNKPEDLWKFLDSVRARGIGVLAIPHNSNLSDGRDFEWTMSDGKPIDAQYAMQRALNEPLVEISQTKGTSETAPQLSPTDEFADFQIMDRIYAGETQSVLHGGYVREALGRGLAIHSQVGANPYKLGFVGGTDIHNGLSTSDENAYASGISGLDPSTMALSAEQARNILATEAAGEGVRPNGQRENDRLQFGSGALTGVWAEENTRESIFAALERRETFATSGTRIRVRMFGGWNFKPDMLKHADWAAAAYAGGVPMGGDLTRPPKGAKGPSFAVQAMKDPSGANLDRIQIVKVWQDGKDYKEKIFDVALSGGRKPNARTGKAPGVGDTVNLKDGSYSNTIGAAFLSAVWTDPDFKPGVPASYYARVLEIPTPRWSTLLAIRNHLPVPTRVAETLQERAWSSPIWFTP
jgi:hypothetical protein